MSSLNVPGFQSSPLFVQLDTGISALPASERTAMVKKVNGLFQLDIKNAAGQTQSWTIDMKTGTGAITLGKAEKKPDVVMTVADADFVSMAEGKLTGQKAFMGGKLKLKGNMMLATKLDVVLKAAQPPKAKL